MNSAVVAHIARCGNADTASKSISLVTLDAVTELNILHIIPSADGIGTTVDGTTATSGDTSITSIALESIVALADSSIAKGILSTVFSRFAFWS